MDEPLIRYANVEIHQQDVCVLKEVDLELRKGEFIFLIGKVGTGKTSLMKTFYGELAVQGGEARVLDYDIARIRRKHIPQLRRRLGIIFQDFQLMTDRTVYSNLEFVLRATGWKHKEEIKERIREVLSLVGMESMGDKMPNELSGGEQQRVVIARSILNMPQIILADEPTGNLDKETGREIMRLLQCISKAGTLVVMITHNTSFLHEFPGRIYCCADHRLKEISQEEVDRSLQNLK